MFSDDESAAIELVQGSSLLMLVRNEIERSILARAVSAGDKLNENAIARRLGVSRGPVREAFRALEGSGLVRVKKNCGVFVREISSDEALEIYEVRAALSDAAGRRLAAGIAAIQLSQLRDLVERMDKAATQREIDDYYPLNLRFHECLMEFTGNRKMIATYHGLVNELHLFRRRGLIHGGGLEVSNDEHRVIVERIAAGDEDGTGVAMRDHVMAGARRMLQSLRGTDAPAD